MKEERVDDDDIFNKSLISFFLAIHNSQVKIANLLFKKYELLRIIVQNLVRIYEKSVAPQRSSNTN